VTLALDEQLLPVDYVLARDGATVSVGGDPVDVGVLSTAPDGVVLEVGGVRRRIAVAITRNRVDVDSDLGSTAFTIVPRFAEPGSDTAAGSLVAPMPGAVVRVAVGEGDEVEAGQLLLVLEAMKMEHPITAPVGGTVSSVAVVVGQQVDGGQVLAVVAPAEASEPAGSTGG
jgi:propionyl-CoA carboxylase alpha chain